MLSTPHMAVQHLLKGRSFPTDPLRGYPRQIVNQDGNSLFALKSPKVVFFDKLTDQQLTHFSDRLYLVYRGAVDARAIRLLEQKSVRGNLSRARIALSS